MRAFVAVPHVECVGYGRPGSHISVCLMPQPSSRLALPLDDESTSRGNQAVMRSIYPLDVESFVCDAIVWHMSGL